MLFRESLQITPQQYNNWLNSLHSFQIWLLLALLILPWIVWWKLVDREKFRKVFYMGLLVIVLSGVIDYLGVHYNLFAYPYQVLPFTKRCIPVIVSFLPVCYMLIYQYCPKWEAFIRCTTALAAILAFIGQPLMKMMNMYQLYHWSYIYSFLILIVIAAVAKYIADWL